MQKKWRHKVLMPKGSFSPDEEKKGYIEELRRKRLEEQDSTACEYCHSTIANSPRTECPKCGLLVCGYHRKPEDHHCISIDWEKKERELKENASPERINEMQKRVLEARTENKLRQYSILVAKILIIAIIGFIVIAWLKGVPTTSPTTSTRESNLTGNPASMFGTKFSNCTVITPAVSPTDADCSMICRSLHSNNYTIIGTTNGPVQCACC